MVQSNDCWRICELRQNVGEIGTTKSISPTFYEQLLCAQIPKVEKDSQVFSVFLHYWDHKKD